MAAKRERKAHIFERENEDWYQEPEWVSRRLLEVENFGSKDITMLDPCCGVGTILGSISEAGCRAIGSDIVDRRNKDFDWEWSQYDICQGEGEKWWSQARSVITNPPFDRLEEVTKRCVEIAEYKTAILFPVRRLPAALWLNNLPLYHVWMLNPRPSIPSGKYIADGGHVGGGTVDFCWIVFRRGHVGEPTMSWLRRDEESKARSRRG